jgi:hypothetical protein
MIEIADVFRRFAADYVSAHGASMHEGIMLARPR